MKNGYILIARAIQESNIWDKPSYYIKAWIYILIKASFRPHNNLNIGECFVTTEEIQKSCAYKVGRRTEQPSKKQIRDFIDFLKSHEGHYEGNNEGHTKGAMIVTKKVKGGMLIKVLNYAIYQNPKYYESNKESNDESSMKDVLKSDESHTKVSTKIEALEALKHLEALEDPLEINNMSNDTPYWLGEELEKQDAQEQEKINTWECGLFDMFEKEFARPISQVELQRLSEWQSMHEDKLIRYALFEAILYNKKSFDYIDRILANWKTQGITVEDYEEGKR